jgi:Ner family transcriptional regulator
MTPEEIKAVLKEKKITASMIAKAMMVKPATVSAVLNKRHPSKRIAVAICKVLDKPLDHVFHDVPSYFETPKEKVQQELDQLLAQAS